MASSSSPALSNNSTETPAKSAAGAASSAAVNGGTPPRRPVLLDAPKQSLRGLNKPKCFQCGNVARSRCPFQSCKSCCAKAQNPCHIHVLKGNATVPEKAAPTSTPPSDQPKSEPSPSVPSFRLSSLRQLSNNFAQFNGAQVSLRTRRPLSRKDAAAINAWRFSKLKEYNDRNIEAENEAFDRYMYNVSLLEEAFFVNTPLEGLAPAGLPEPGSDTLTSEDETQKLILGIKVKLKSNAERAEKRKKRLWALIDQGLKKLQKHDFNGEKGSANMDDVHGERELKKPKKAKKLRAERMTAINDLLDKLNKARNEEELKACLQIKLQLFNQMELNDKVVNEKSGSSQVSDQMLEDQNDNEDVSLSRDSRQETDAKTSSSVYSLPKLCSTIEVNKEILSNVDTQFSSPDQVVEL